MTTKSGFAFHCHHETLVEWTYDYNDRVEYIKSEKSEEEIELRLRLFQMIPEDRIPTGLRNALEVYKKAQKVYENVLDSCDKAQKVYDKAQKVYGKAGKVYDKAWMAYKDHFITLHTELCPDCPWDGWTIFPNRRILC